MEIRAVEVLKNTDQLKKLVREYLDHETSELRAISNFELDATELVSSTSEHIDEYLPSSGALHLAIDAIGSCQRRRKKPATGAEQKSATWCRALGRDALKLQARSKALGH